MRVMREARGVALPPEPARLARVAKAARLTLTGLQSLERAVSSAGGVTWDAVDAHLMLKALPGVRGRRDAGLGGADGRLPAAGLFATGVAAAKGVLALSRACAPTSAAMSLVMKPTLR